MDKKDERVSELEQIIKNFELRLNVRLDVIIDALIELRKELEGNKYIPKHSKEKASERSN